MFRVKHRWCSRVHNSLNGKEKKRLEDTNNALPVVVSSSVVNFKFY